MKQILVEQTLPAATTLDALDYAYTESGLVDTIHSGATLLHDYCRQIVGAGKRAVELFREPLGFPGSDLEPRFEWSAAGAARGASWRAGER